MPRPVSALLKEKLNLKLVLDDRDLQGKTLNKKDRAPSPVNEDSGDHTKKDESKEAPQSDLDLLSTLVEGDNLSFDSRTQLDEGEEGSNVVTKVEDACASDEIDNQVESTEKQGCKGSNNNCKGRPKSGAQDHCGTSKDCGTSKGCEGEDSHATDQVLPTGKLKGESAGPKSVKTLQSEGCSRPGSAFNPIQIPSQLDLEDESQNINEEIPDMRASRPTSSSQRHSPRKNYNNVPPRYLNQPSPRGVNYNTHPNPG